MTDIKEDWDFDFTQYEREDEQESNINILDKQASRVDTLRSKYSNSLNEMDRLNEIGILISKYSIKIASRTPDKNIIRKYYGLLNEFWASIRYIKGKETQERINDLMKECRVLIFDKEIINENLYNKLLTLRNKLYKIKQFSNLGFEVEKTNRTTMQQVKEQIRQ